MEIPPEPFRRQICGNVRPCGGYRDRRWCSNWATRTRCSVHSRAEPCAKLSFRPGLQTHGSPPGEAGPRFRHCDLLQSRTLMDVCNLCGRESRIAELAARTVVGLGRDRVSPELQPAGHNLAGPLQAGKTSAQLEACLRSVRWRKQVGTGSSRYPEGIIDDNRNQESDLREPAIVLLPILPVGTAHLEVKMDGSICGTRPAVVNGLGSGKKDDALARLPETIAPVNIFSVHEEAWIERAYAIQCGAPDQNKPAVQHLHRGSG